MSVNNRQKMTALVGGVIGLVAMTGFLAGCGSKEPEAPKGTTYYTGPMVKKNNPAGPGTKSAPNSDQ